MSSFHRNKVLEKIDKNCALKIYNVAGTDDYYVLGAINSEAEEIGIYNDLNEKMESKIERIGQTSFIVSYLEGFSHKYYALVDNHKIYFSND
jgi:hypothetical protein